METFVTSDHHFGHKNILKFQPNRNFDSVEEHNEQLIQRHNEVVKEKDHVYMLGDFIFGTATQADAILKRMNGKKFFVFGNHDRPMYDERIQKHFEWMKNYHEMKLNGHNVVMFHFPIHSWNRMSYGSYHLYGHTHCQIPHLYHGFSMDVGVDGSDCYPHNLDDIYAGFDRIKDEYGNDSADDPRNYK